MERVFCENCGRQRRAVEAVGAYEGTPYCDPCRKADDISEEFFVRFGVHGNAPDAAPRSQVAPPEAAARSGEGDTPESLLATAAPRCIDCGATLRLRRGKPARAQCRVCEKKAKRAPIPTITEGVIVKVDRKNKTITVDPLAQRKRLGISAAKPKPEGLELLTDDAYAQLRPNNADGDLFRKLLGVIGERKSHPCRVKLDCKKRGDVKNFANRVRRMLRINRAQAFVETFPSASCIVVSVGYGKQAK